jgi:hypothetical protein
MDEAFELLHLCDGGEVVVHGAPVVGDSELLLLLLHLPNKARLSSLEPEGYEAPFFPLIMW